MTDWKAIAITIAWLFGASIFTISIVCVCGFISNLTPIRVVAFKEENMHHGTLTGMTSIIYHPYSDNLDIVVYNDNGVNLYEGTQMGCVKTDNTVMYLKTFDIEVSCSCDNGETYSLTGYTEDPVTIQFSTALTGIIIKPFKEMTFRGKLCTISLISGAFYINDHGGCTFYPKASVRRVNTDFRDYK